MDKPELKMIDAIDAVKSWQWNPVSKIEETCCVDGVKFTLIERSVGCFLLKKNGLPIYEASGFGAKDAAKRIAILELQTK